MRILVTGLDRLFEDCARTLTVAQVARLLGLSQAGVYGWIRQGVIPAYKVGSMWIIVRDELRDVMAAGANGFAD